jgi:hypothetical protein
MVDYILIINPNKMFRILFTTNTQVFLTGVVAGITNMSVLTYILIDNERWNHKREKTILPVQMR